MSTQFLRPYPKHLVDTLKLLVSFLQHHPNLWNSFALRVSAFDRFDVDKLWTTLYV